MLVLGIAFNLGLLGYFKYANFLLDNINHFNDANIALMDVALPLAISFFTFQQIAYLVDCYKAISKEYSFINYCLFITFFPQLIAGPIVHHREMMPQFNNLRRKIVNWKCITAGCTLFIIGLFKKVVIADTFAIWADAGFAEPAQLNMIEAWGASLSYTFQLYYDFSGYTDMAIGAAIIFNIHLPVNFNSPYKATNIQDFWRRWHITLSRWLRDYIYIPLGGNQGHAIKVYTSIFLTFIVGGIWHGAGWTFVIWGALHGAAMIVHRLWQSTLLKMHKAAAWCLTFLFVNFCWVFFRATSLDDAMIMLDKMTDLEQANVRFSLSFVDQLSGFINIGLQNILPWKVGVIVPDISILLVLMMLPFIVFCRNSMQLKDRLLTDTYYTKAFICYLSVMGVTALSFVAGKSSETFLYFNF
jgi:D-alanyl-lipoteichoic acid acyltransferase DltB (MBOAT superfamily)